jgi:pSer/pThr/pTyr-binding forkhead associated (FHA) protein
VKRPLRLRGISGDIKGQVWESESLLRAGRLGSLEIVLDDSSVSRRHAEIRITQHGWRVKDLGSTNGTSVNGKKLDPSVERLLLRGDKVTISVFEIEVVEANSPAEPETKDLPREKERQEPAAVEMTIAVGARIQSPLANLARLKHAQPRLVMATKERRAVFEIVKAEAIVGRDPASDVVIDHGTVSKRHAEVRLLDGTFYVRDLGTVNGTFVEGSAVVGAAAPLKSNQTVRFGTVSCLFLTRPPEGTEAQEEQAAAQVARLLVHRGVVPPGQMESLQSMVRSSGRSLAELAVTAGVVEPEAWSKLRAQADVIELVGPQPGRPWFRWVILLAVIAFAVWAGARWWPQK